MEEHNRPYYKKASEIEDLPKLLANMTDEEKLRAIDNIQKQLGIEPLKKEII